MSRTRTAAVVLGVVLAVAPTQLRATDGHFLHGVGAINAAMGGAGVAAPTSLLGTFYLNPAGLVAFNEGTRFEFGFEMFKADRTVASEFQPFGSGSTASSSEFTPIPAMGWSAPLADGKVVVGLAGIGVGGFGVDYAADLSNPVLSSPGGPSSTPRFPGFGAVFSDYGLLKITPAIGIAASDNLWIGFAANIDYATLSVKPMPVAAPAVFDPDGTMGNGDELAVYSGAADKDGAFGFGFQAGVLFKPVPQLAVGASFSSEQYFEEFAWDAVYENPFLSNFNEPRTDVTFKLNVPMMVAGGVAFEVTPQLMVAGDARYFFYEDTDGFSVPASGPFNPDGSVAGFGWENILSLHGGIQFVPTPTVALRAGYNHTQNPVPDNLSMFNVPAPAIVQDHVSVGIGIRPTTAFEISAGFYHVFENSGTGPFFGPTGAVPNATVTNSMSENSILLQFSYSPAGIN